MELKNRICANFGQSRIKINRIAIKYTKTNLALSISNVQMNSSDLKKQIILPTILSPLLAEEIGIILVMDFYRLKEVNID